MDQVALHGTILCHQWDQRKKNDYQGNLGSHATPFQGETYLITNCLNLVTIFSDSQAAIRVVTKVKHD